MSSHSGELKKRVFRSADQLDLLQVEIKSDGDAVFVRQRARQIADLFGLDHQSQTRFATAVSELARNVHQYAKVGRVYFSVELTSDQNSVVVEFVDSGPGIQSPDVIFGGSYVSSTGLGVGLLGAKRLSDRFKIETGPSGTQIQIAKTIPPRVKMSKEQVAQIADRLVSSIPKSPIEEMRSQNQDLMLALQQLEKQQEELRELNQELAETNSGVLALYAELDEKAQSLQRANETKSNFLSHMTHEFRTPLTSIISITNLLLDRFDGDLTSEQEKQVQFIAGSGRGLLELVNDLLDLAKVESGRVSIKVTEFDVGMTLGALRGMFKPILLSNPNLQLTLNDPAVPLLLTTDEGKLSQILRNFISNAVKFTKAGEIELNVLDLGDEVAFSVRDSGIGISKDNLGRVFEEFKQLDDARIKPVSGTGLGLPLSQKLAKLLGGRIHVESQLEIGSTFTLTIPKQFSGDDHGVLIESSNSSVGKSYDGK